MMKTKEKNASAKRKSFYKDLMHYEPTLKCGKNIGTKENGGEVYIETKMFGDSVEMARSWAYASVENIGRKRLAYWINSQIPPPTCPKKVVKFEINGSHSNYGEYSAEENNFGFWYELKANLRVVISCQKIDEDFK